VIQYNVILENRKLFASNSFKFETENYHFL